MIIFSIKNVNGASRYGNKTWRYSGCSLHNGNCNKLLILFVATTDLQKVASTQAVLGDTKTPQVPAGDTFWLAWINFLGLVTHIIIRDEKIKGICTCFHHIYTIMCLVHQIGLLCMVFVFWYQIMSRITLFFGQIFVANHAVLVTHFDP